MCVNNIKKKEKIMKAYSVLITPSIKSSFEEDYQYQISRLVTDQLHKKKNHKNKNMTIGIHLTIPGSEHYLDLTFDHNERQVIVTLADDPLDVKFEPLFDNPNWVIPLKKIK